jgi:hypothetical protein
MAPTANEGAEQRQLSWSWEQSGESSCFSAFGGEISCHTVDLHWERN